MVPPSPPSAPPRAVSAPETVVTPSDQTAMEPPFPRVSASAVIVLAVMVVLKAWVSVPRPRAPPPTAMLPPPVAPDASILVCASLTAPVPVTATEPPAPLELRVRSFACVSATSCPVAEIAPPRLAPEALSLPETATSPPSPPPRMIEPPTCLAERAVT